MSTKELIDSIYSGNSTEVDNNFNQIMVNKVSEKLDIMRQDLSQNMFRFPKAEDFAPEPKESESAE